MVYVGVVVLLELVAIERPFAVELGPLPEDVPSVPKPLNGLLVLYP